MANCKTRIAAFFLLATTLVCAQAAAPDSAHKPAIAKHFMAATANPLATDAAYAILKRGGSAVDAAIAAQMVLNLVEPQSSGIGGGAFIVYYSARDRRVVTFDGRETAPAAAKPDRFLGPDGKPEKFYDAVVGGKSVGVPGLLRALDAAHRKYGRIAWAELFAPAIRLAENGFIVSPRLARELAEDKHLATQGTARRYFYHADGTPLRSGERLRNPALAATLRIIAARGADAFYRGAIAHDIVAAVDAAPANPGDLALGDLASYRAVERAPVCGPYRGFRVCGMGPPSSGGVTVLQMLGILSHFSLKSAPPESLMAAHLFAEAGKLAYADRDLYLADPSFVRIPLRGMLAPAYLARRARLISLSEALPRAQPGTPPMMQPLRRGEDEPLELPSTSHLSIVDSYGDALAMTTTIENAFGSRLMVDGFLLNNELTDFSFVPEQAGKPVANRVEPGKRPRSSMAPTIVLDSHGRVYAVLGSPGGSRIINYVAQVLVALLDWRLDPQSAVSLGHYGNRNGPTELEKGTAAARLREGLQLLGDKVRVVDQNSGTQVIEWRDGRWWGGADPRREGTARGD